MRIQLATGKTWSAQHVLPKLYARSGLPGAQCYDKAAAALFEASAKRRDHGAGLLPAAIASSWLVNAKATSPVFARWLDGDLQNAWRELFGALRRPYKERLDDEQADLRIAECSDAILSVGGNVCALSKVCALFAPDAVPLMDDAALSLLTGVVPSAPEGTEAAPADAFAPAVRAFAGLMRQVHSSLEAYAANFAFYPLRPGAVLDRVLWFDSFGYSHFAAYRLEASGDVHAVVPVEGAT